MLRQRWTVGGSERLEGVLGGGGRWEVGGGRWRQYFS